MSRPSLLTEGVKLGVMITLLIMICVVIATPTHVLRAFLRGEEVKASPEPVYVTTWYRSGSEPIVFTTKEQPNPMSNRVLLKLDDGADVIIFDGAIEIRAKAVEKPVE